MDTLPLTSIGAEEIGNHSRLVQGLMAKSLNVPTFLPSEFRRFAQRWASSDFKTHRGTSGYRLPDLVEIVRQLERDSRVTRDGPALEEEYEVCPSDEEIERLIKAHHWIPEFLMNPSPIRAQAIAYASAHPDTPVHIFDQAYQRVHTWQKNRLCFQLSWVPRQQRVDQVSLHKDR